MVRASTSRVPNHETTKGVALRIPEDILDDLREEARAARRSLNAHIVWLLSHRHEPTDDPYEGLLRLAGTLDVEDISGELRTLERAERSS